MTYLHAIVIILGAALPKLLFVGAIYVLSKMAIYICQKGGYT